MKAIILLTCLLTLAPLALSQTPPQWEQGPLLSTPRMFHGAAVLGGTIYVFGGIDDHRQPLRSVEILRPDAEAWEEGPDLPVPLYNMAVVSVGRQIMIIGGSDDQRMSSETVLFFDPNRGQFSRGPALPQPRSGLAATVEGGSSVLVMGGMANRGMPEPTGFRLPLNDADHWEDDVPPMNSRRLNFGLIWNEASFAVGGIHYGPVNSIEVLTPHNGWQNLSRLPVARGELGVVSPRREIVCIGGRDREGRALNQVDVYLIDQQSWITLPLLERPRAGLTTVIAGSKIYAIGGITSPQYREAVLNTVEVYDLSPDSVSAPPDLNPALPVTLLSFYPNPANGVVSFNLPGFSAGWMRLFDPLGRLIVNQPVSGAKGSWVWEVSQAPNGNYLLLIMDEEGSALARSRLTVLK